MKSQPLVNRRLAWVLTALQGAMIVVAAAIAALYWGALGAKSAALGAGLYWLASAFFTWQSFKTAGARASKQVMRNMYIGLIGKFAIVIIGMMLILTKLMPIDMLALLVGFVLSQLMVWCAPWLLKNVI